MATTKTNNWPITAERMITVMKLSYFKNRITSDLSAHLELMANVISIIKDIEKPVAIRVIQDDEEHEDIRGSVVKGLICADSIILISKDLSQGATLHFIGSIMRLQMSLLDLGVGIRGGLSTGMITADLEDRAFFGEPVNEAYSIADSLQFYGVAEKHTEQTLESMDSIRVFDSDSVPLFYPKFAPTSNGSILCLIVNLSMAVNNEEDIDHIFGSIKPKLREKKLNQFYSNTIKIYKEAYQYTYGNRN
ncbi:hypothetical protein [Niabella hibiscisoli]|uniref:hypothetical protein n=1 Tax=Niabella hibiscisoli TaxID=1825928 RepID=UPI001F0EB7CC|nr:hypothetical protein [Niabella hibiscisoli]MCH5716679.1 hypothetical protein [Niabella hibiscisoli]